MTDVAASPFLKYPGGKTGQLAGILAALPTQMNIYAEPFIGGGSVFFALANESSRRYRRAIINDVNWKLTQTYITVRDHVHDLIERLSTIERCFSPLLSDVVNDGRKIRYPSAESYYRSVITNINEYAKRKTPIDDIAVAEYYVFLNKTGFRGMYRENSRGEYNIPYGNYAKPKICNAPLLLACSKALRDVEIRCGDFTGATSPLWSGDAVYLDPPYIPTSETANFTGYSADGFGHDDQVRLANEIHRLSDSGVSVVLSNSDTPISRALYLGRHRSCLVQDVKYAANPYEKGEGSRGTTGNLLVTYGAR